MFEHLLRTPKVHEVAMKFLTEVNSGFYDLQKSLPSVRSIGERYDVSIFTVHRALDELKKAGFIRSEGRKASYINGDAIGNINEIGESENQNGSSVTLLVRRYSDLKKLGSSLLREKAHQRLNHICPDLKIKEIQISSTGQDYHADLFNRMLSGPYPTVGTLPQSCLDIYSDFNLLKPFDTDYFSEHLKRLKPVYQEICKRNKNLLLLPNSVTFSFLLYNKISLAKFGLEPESFMEREFFYDFLKRLKNEKEITLPLAMGFGSDMLYFLMHLIYQSQGALRVGDIAPQIEWSYEEIKTGVDFFCRLVFDEKLVGFPDSEIDLVPKLIKGDIPFCFDSGQTAGAVLRSGKADEIGIMPFPCGPNQLLFSLANVAGFFINSKSKQLEAEAGNKYISHWLDLFCNSDEGPKLERQYKRSYKAFSVFKDERKDRSVYESIPDDWMEAFCKLETHPVFESSGSDWEKARAYDVFGKLLKEDGKVEPHELVLYLNSHINSAKFWEEK